MPNAVLRLAIGFNLGETRAVELLYIVKIGRDEDDGHEQEPSKQNDSDHHKLHRWTARALECANVIRPFRGAPRPFVFLFYYFQQGATRDVEPHPARLGASVQRFSSSMILMLPCVVQ